MNTPFFKIHDIRIGSDNYIFQTTIGEYYDLMKDSLFNNLYQRKRVQNSKTIYALLKSDLVVGCVMPPIVLSIDSQLDESRDIMEQLKEKRDNLIILDGLQRSLSICDLLKEEPNKSQIIRSHTIRIELYSNLSKTWLLYRMLTLNTGQTQMSTRHQIEIIYSDFKSNCKVKDVTLITQSEDVSPSELGEYNFRDVVDGFTSYIQMDYLRLDRVDILDNVSNMERLASMAADVNIFESFISTFHTMIKYLNDNVSCDELDCQIQLLDLKKDPFGKTIIKIFNKSQVLTGFGAAIAKLRQLDDIRDFSHIKELILKIDSQSILPGVLKIIKDLDEIRNIAKKIGNDQRFYFYHFFKAMFSIDNEQHSVEKAARKAYNQYEREVL